MKKTRLLAIAAAAASLSLIIPVTAFAETDSSAQYDILSNLEAAGPAFRLLDPTGWYSRAVTKVPDYSAGEGIAYLYTDDLGEQYQAGDFGSSLMEVSFRSWYTFELAEGLSEQQTAAFEALLTEFAASRETLVYTAAGGTQQLSDYALRSGTPDELMQALDAEPEVKAAIAKITCTPVLVSSARVRTDSGLRFFTASGEKMQEETLRQIAEEQGFSWTVNGNEVIPETVTTESLAEVISAVVSAGPAMLEPSALTDTGMGISSVSRVLYEKTAEPLKGDLDGDGKLSANDASIALAGATEIVAGFEPEERTLTAEQEQLADVDGNGKLTAVDASCILTFFTLVNAGYENVTMADVIHVA